jgi:hypothetical protein
MLRTALKRRPKHVKMQLRERNLHFLVFVHVRETMGGHSAVCIMDTYVCGVRRQVLTKQVAASSGTRMELGGV